MFINTASGHWSFLVHRKNDFSHWLLTLDWFGSIEPKHPKHQPNHLSSAASVMIDDNIISWKIYLKFLIQISTKYF